MLIMAIAFFGIDALITVITFYYVFQTINLLIVIVILFCALNCGRRLLCLDHVCCLLLCS
jgi:hypothetical protein